MKTIGIIGGFGPEATAQFYLRLLARRRTHVIMRHVVVPRTLEENALVHGKNLDAFVPLLQEAARDLEQRGADIIVLPCNTLHVHEKAIRAAITVPFVSIIASTVHVLNEKNISEIGLLGSRVTIKENLFHKQTSRISFVCVPDVLQKKIDQGLDHFVSTQNGSHLRKALTHAFTFFQQKNIRNVLLACTDFDTVRPKTSTLRVFDTLDILVSATVDML